MDNIVDWLSMLRANKLYLNLKKTHFILFRRKVSEVKVDKDVIIDNKKISMIAKTKFLGVVIDKCLTFEQHIAFTKGKISRGLGRYVGDFFIKKNC